MSDFITQALAYLWGAVALGVAAGIFSVLTDFRR